jgi:hypothetical protein
VPVTIVVVAAVHAAMVGLAMVVGYRAFGREVPPVLGGRVTRPPDDLTPGEVAALAEEGEVSQRAWVATLVDLLARGILVPGRVVEKIDGGSESGVGILRVNDDRNLMPHEEAVRGLLARVVADTPVARADMKAAIRHRSRSAAETAAGFSGALRRLLDGRSYLIVDGTTFTWVVLSFLTVGAAMLLLSMGSLMTGASTDAVRSAAIGLMLGTIVAWFVALPLLRLPRLWVSRSERGARAAAQWRSYGDHLAMTRGAELRRPDAETGADRAAAFAVALGLLPELEEAWRGAAPDRLPPVAAPPR